MRKKTALAAAVTGLLALSTASNATVLIKKTLVDLAGDADLILSGTVTEVWSEQDGASISTYADVQVIDLLKGASESEIVTVKVPGGAVGDLSMAVPGTPELSENQEVYLFLKNEMGTLTNVVGWAQGAFHVEDGVVLEVGVPQRAFERRVEAILGSAAN
ncbi:MAG: hypothetical protein CME06_08075 [Gemmatimonadetes bacterium]|nr:hypothetical protein [Gemmatimonadota bacterium]